MILLNNYTKSRCLNNIYFLAKQKGEKIKDLELKAGVSIGYLSRISKEDNTKKMSIDLVAAIAQELDISIDRLIFDDLTAILPGEQRIYDFIEKLIAKTENGEINWDKMLSVDVSTLSVYGDGKTSHPQYHCDKNGTPFFYSYFHSGHDTCQDGIGFSYEIQEDIEIMLYRVKRGSSPICDYEMYFYIKGSFDSPSKLEPVCGTISNEENVLNPLMKQLYTTVADSCKNVKLSPTVQNIISDFMGTTTPSKMT